MVRLYSLSIKFTPYCSKPCRLNFNLELIISLNANIIAELLYFKDAKITDTAASGYINVAIQVINLCCLFTFMLPNIKTANMKIIYT